jgi:hypothetical protein
MGLQPSRDDRAVRISDFQEAFNPISPVRAVKIPAAQNKRGERSSSSRWAGSLFGVTLLAAAATLFFQFAPPKYLDPIYDSEFMQKFQSMLFDRGSAPPPKTAVVNSAAVLSPAEETGEGLIDEAPESDSNLDLTNGATQPVQGEEVETAKLSVPAKTFAVDAAEYFISESGTALAVQIKRQGDVTGTASVEWRTIADSAEPNVDYVDLGRRKLQFVAGEENKSIFIPIVSDAIVERNEYFRIAIREPGDETATATAYAAIVTIIDDDS